MLKDIDKKEMLQSTLFRLSSNQEQVQELTVSFVSTLRLNFKHQSGWLNDEILDLFADAMNLCFGASSTEQEDGLPNVCYIKQMELEHCWAFSPITQNRPTITVEDKNFSNKLESVIVKGHGKNQVAHMLHVYKSRSNIKDKSLEKIFGIMNLNRNHFVQVSINFATKQVVTRDPMKKEIDGSILRRKWLSKICAISHHLYVSDDNQNMYIGNKDMLMSPSFTTEDEKSIKENSSHKFMFYHENKTQDIMYPAQKGDSVNCGIFSLWYNLLEIYGPDKICSINPKRWRKQMFIFIIVLKMYYEKTKDRLYTFPETLDIKMWLLTQSLPQDVHNVFNVMFGNKKKDSDNDVDSEEDIPDE